MSWNVNGLRACIQKGFLDVIRSENPDIIALQEIKMLKEQADFTLNDYHIIWNSAEKKGYSGTAVFMKNSPVSVTLGLGEEIYDCEGRTVTVETDRFYLINSYSPNSQDQLKRIRYRINYDNALRLHMMRLDGKKPVILCGDLNVAHQPIDLKNPKENEGCAGYSEEERSMLSQTLSCGFLDSFRTLHPNQTGAYTWWSYRFNSRARNAGWRIDYFILSDRLLSSVEDSCILSEIPGSDHCPITLLLKESSL